jgi:spermidine/putrescine transport system ATP-binding protein
MVKSILARRNRSLKVERLAVPPATRSRRAKEFLPVPEVTAVEVRSVTKTFGAAPDWVRALDDVSISIGENEFFTLLGPSGCGKTTLLRLIAGFELPNSGDILLADRSVVHLPPHERPVNTVFQNYALFPHMNVARNIAFGLEMRGLAQDEIARTVDEMLALVKMQGLDARRPGQLSGGQQQRVALARALANHPKVLLLDEPLSALDLKLRQGMRGELKSLQQRTGITFIFVTHDQEEALTMSDRIAVMDHGRVQQLGTPLDIYERPVNRFVADFIGDTNFLAATAVGEENGLIRCRCEGGFELLVGGNRPAPGAAVTVALRPEKIVLLPGGAHGTVVQAVYVGTDTNYEVQVSESTRLSVRVQNAVDGRPRFALGERVGIEVPPGAARLLRD